MIITLLKIILELKGSTSDAAAYGSVNEAFQDAVHLGPSIQLCQNDNLHGRGLVTEHVLLNFFPSCVD